MSKKVETIALNPFEKGVTYAQFLESIGEKSIDEALKDICTEEQIEFVKKEVSILKKQ